MPLNLRIFVIVFAVILFLSIIRILKKGRMSEKYSLIWLAMSIIILLVGLTPNFLTDISKLIGFEVMSNMVIGIILVLLVFVTVALTVMVSGQKKKITLLIQEVSMLKKELNDKK